jgi:hypothetical protein
MFVILNVSTGPKERGTTAGIAVGSVIALEALFAGPICGASMNPARSVAPALVSQHISDLWIYLVAPIAGSLLAVIGCRCVREAGCCSLARFLDGQIRRKNYKLTRPPGCRLNCSLRNPVKHHYACYMIRYCRKWAGDISGGTILRDRLKTNEDRFTDLKHSSGSSTRRPS